MRAISSDQPIDFEPVDSGYVKVKGEVWLGPVEESEGGGYVDFYKVYVPEPEREQGGGYFDR